MHIHLYMSVLTGHTLILHVLKRKFNLDENILIKGNLSLYFFPVPVHSQHS
jgi:hypothetical protein